MDFIVTGGSRGLGKAIVLQAIKEGHNVAFTYVSNEQAANEVVAQAQDLQPNCKIKSYQLNVSSSQRVEEVVDKILSDFDRIDVLVNNAGINKDNLAVNMTDEEWDEVLQTNLTGPFYLCRQVLPIMLSQKFGRIINISSLQCRGGRGQANYSASKAGLNGLTQSLAKEYGKKGINSNVIVPGFFETDMTEESMPQEQRDMWKKYCPHPGEGLGKPAELAKVVTFLASDAGNYINGEIMNITGGIFMTL